MFITSFESVLLAVGLFAGMCLCEVLGHRFGRREVAANREAPRGGVVEAAVLALLGLLLAFSFSGAASRLDYRRELIVQESNAIGTAWLRLDMLPAADQAPLRELFKRYVDERIAIIKALPDVAEAMRHNDESIRIQGEIWSLAVNSTKASPTPQAAILLLPALNEMIDITTTRKVAGQVRTPTLIVALLFAIALLSALIAGYTLAHQPQLKRTHVTIFSLVVSITVYVILDLGNPRAGLIRLNKADTAMTELRESMK